MAVLLGLTLRYCSAAALFMVVVTQLQVCQGLRTKALKVNVADKYNYGRVGTITELDFQDFTLCGYFKLTNINGGGTGVGIATQPQTNGFFMEVFPGNVRAYSPSTSLSTSTSSNSYFLQWHEVCVTRAGSTGTIYFDGQLKETGAIGNYKFGIKESMVVLGQDHDNYGGEFGTTDSFDFGMIANFNIWDSVIDMNNKLCTDIGNALSSVPSANFPYVQRAVTELYENITCPYDNSVMVDQLVFSYDNPNHKSTTYFTTGVTNVRLEQTLYKNTFCFWYKLYDHREHDMVGVATINEDGSVNGNNPRIQLKANLLRVLHNTGWNVEISSTDAYRVNTWMHLCEATDIQGSQYGIYLDGVKLYDSVLFTASSHTPWRKATITLGQDVDCYGGCFQGSQQFRGELTGMNLWDQFLTTEQIELIQCSDVGNIFSWNTLGMTLFGSVTYEDTTELSVCADIGNSIAPLGGPTAPLTRGRHFCPLSGWVFTEGPTVISVLTEPDLVSCTQMCVLTQDCQAILRDAGNATCSLVKETPMLNPEMMGKGDGPLIYSFDTC